MSARADRGFTLVEVLLAVSLLAVVSAGLYRALTAGLLLDTRTRSALQAHRELTELERTLQDDLDSALSLEVEPSSLQITKKGGEPGRIAFTRYAPSPQDSTLHRTEHDGDQTVKSTRWEHVRAFHLVERSEVGLLELNILGSTMEGDVADSTSGARLLLRCSPVLLGNQTGTAP